MIIEARLLRGKCSAECGLFVFSKSYNKMEVSPRGTNIERAGITRGDSVPTIENPVSAWDDLLILSVRWRLSF